MRWYLSGCPACGGDLYEDLDTEGWATCLMCARSFQVAQLKSLRGRLAPEPAERRISPRLPEVAQVALSAEAKHAA